VLCDDSEISVTVAGFDGITKHLTLKSDEPAHRDIQLTLKGQTQAITTTHKTPGVA